MRVFNQGDEAYYSWMEANPEGYILNLPTNDQRREVILHRSGCHQISRKRKLGAYTERDWFKVGNEDMGPLLSWLAQKRPAALKYYTICKTCQPEATQTIPDPKALAAEQTILPGTFEEGEAVTVTSKAYRRSEEARLKCLEYHGYRCQVCELSFEEAYGEIGRGFIEVHHLVPVSSRGGVYEVDPIRDLIPVCPNCHRMLHRQEPPFSVEELRGRMGRR